MSRGSTFTLYRAYNNFKINEETKNKILTAYHDFNKKHDWYHDGAFNENLTEEEKDKIKREREERWTNDIPIVLNLDFNENYNWDSSKNSDNETISEYRNRKYANYALKDDGRYCDKLLEWNFTSGFDCLIEHFGLNYCTFDRNSVIISIEDAKEMLTAVEYLLGGKWDDSLERSMNNKWIKIFSDGGNCDSYWKYVYRHKISKNGKIHKFSDNGVEVTVSIPSSNNNDEEDDYSFAETSESNEAMEFYLRNTANALRAFIESDNWSYGNETELILVYSSWG